MKAHKQDDLRAFHAFLGKKLKDGGPNPSPEEAMREWRDLHPEPAYDAEELAAIREAIADMEAGDRGRPGEEVIAEIRNQLGLPSERLIVPACHPDLFPSRSFNASASWPNRKSNLSS